MANKQQLSGGRLVWVMSGNRAQTVTPLRISATDHHNTYISTATGRICDSKSAITTQRHSGQFKTRPGSVSPELTKLLKIKSIAATAFTSALIIRPPVKPLAWGGHIDSKHEGHLRLVYGIR